MTGFRELLEVLNGAKLRGDGFIVADTIGRVLTFLNADGVDGHHPHHVHTQITDGVNTGSYCVQ